MSIQSKSILSDFQMMLADKWGYIPATAGTLWTQAKQDATQNAMAQKYGSKWIGHMVADCSGAFVYSYKKYGESIYHGSNRIARKYVVELLPISEAKPGMAAFKFYAPGQKGYNLPENYKQGGSQYNGDLNDYYHIGLVDEDPRYVLNSATTVNGFIRSKITNGWNACGYLKAVDYSGESGKDDDEPVVENETMIVTAESGQYVNMRESTSMNSRLIVRVPVGSEVTVIKTDKNGWTGVKYKRYEGYMMTRFLAEKPEADGTTADSTSSNTDQQKPTASTSTQANPNNDLSSIIEERNAYRLMLEEASSIILEEIDALQKLAFKIYETLNKFDDNH